MDVQNNPKWRPAAEETQWLDEGDDSPGRRARQVSRFLGTRVELVAEIVHWDPPERASWKAECRVEPEHGGRRLTMAGKGETVGGLFGKLSDPVVARILARQAQDDLANLKVIKERRAERKMPPTQAASVAVVAAVVEHITLYSMVASDLQKRRSAQR